MPSIAYGWGAPKLAEQIADVPPLGELSADELERFQKDADAVSWLFGRRIIPHSQHQKSYDKITKEIGKAIGNARANAAKSHPVDHSIGDGLLARGEGLEASRAGGGDRG